MSHHHNHHKISINEQPHDDDPQPEVVTEAQQSEQAEAGAQGEQTAERGEQVEHDIEELCAKAAQRDEYVALAQRTQADFENYRRRMTKELSSAKARGAAKLASDLLPALDNLERAVTHIQGNDEHAEFAQGVQLVYSEMLEALARTGIKPFSPEGEQFDPNRHEAVLQRPAEDAASGTVIEVYQRGYCADGEILRPAKVVVAE
jgi:molecular chaperone GrpE